METALNVYQYGTGGKCVRLFIHTYACIWNDRHADRKGGHTYE